MIGPADTRYDECAGPGGLQKESLTSGTSVTLSAVEATLRDLGLTGPLLRTILERLWAVRRPGDAKRPIAPKAMPDLLSIARSFHRESLRRTDIMGHRIDDPSWNMLLAIFADTLEDRTVSTSSAIYASGVPPTTALRCVERLVVDDLIRKKGDPRDRRRTLLLPTDSMMERTEIMIHRLCVTAPSTSP